MAASPNVAVVGAGPAGLAAAEVLAQAGLQVRIHDRMPSPARKFLMAGRGGLNLTHSESLDLFLTRYGAAADRLGPAIRAFPPDALREWAAGLGEETFIGTSGRVFPRAFKASPLLRAWLRRLDGSTFALRHAFAGWAPDGALLFDTPQGRHADRADVVLLALGGASWPRLGSDGGWVEMLRGVGVPVVALSPANMGVNIPWSDLFRDRFAGTPLKRIALTFEGRTVRGEAIVTREGLEGGAVYAISAAVREALAGGPVPLHLDLRPDIDTATLARRIAAAPMKDSTANMLRKAAGLSPVAAAVLRESAPALPSRPNLAALIKAVPLRLTGHQGLARAISSAGGIRWDAVGPDFALRGLPAHLPAVFAAGEMLDWEAPTGGYLLQACIATGRAAAQGILARLSR